MNDGDALDLLVLTIRKLEKKVPSINSGNDFWRGYKEAIKDLWVHVEILEAKKAASE